VSSEIVVSALSVVSTLVQRLPAIAECHSHVAFRPIDRAIRMTVPETFPSRMAKPLCPGPRVFFSILAAFSRMTMGVASQD
jgi:hypothetical protein